MKIKLLLSAIALSVLAASCGSDDNATPQSKKKLVPKPFKALFLQQELPTPKATTAVCTYKHLPT